MIDKVPGATYEILYDGFRWELPEKFNIGTACSDQQDATALALIEVADGRTREYDFGELTQGSNRLANGLASLGVERGDRVAIMLPQGYECGLSHLATYKLGAIAVPMTQLFGPEALRYRLGDCLPKVVITDSSTRDVVVEIVEEVGGITVVLVGTGDNAADQDFDDLIASASTAFAPADTAPDDPALLIYTSGTTGPPKGALHGHRVLLGHLPGFELMFDFFPGPDECLWSPADWAWIGGLLDAVIPSWFHGRPVVATPRARFEPRWALDLIIEHQVTSTFLPPTALKMMRQAELEVGDDVPLRTIMTGGEPLGSETLTWGQEHLGVRINEIYGQTEANLLVGNSSNVWEVRPGSMGRPFPGHTVAILGSDGRFEATDIEGEIIVHADDPVVMLGYWHNAEATERKFVEIAGENGQRGRWLRTGDLGRCDADGYLWFSSREDDVIMSAGYRIGPAEIEECVLTHPAVAMVAAVGIPDPIRGEAVKVFVTLRDGFEPSDELADQIRQHVRSRLAAYEYPREVEFLAELPTTTTGKVRRQDLRTKRPHG